MNFYFALLVVSVAALGANGQATPTIIWHGMGDNCCLPFSMGHQVKLVEDNTPDGTYVHSLMIGDNAFDDTVNGFFKDVNEQVTEVCDYIANDPQLQNGYNAVGYSQGGQFLRAVAQRCPSPPMKNLVTLGSQHQGVYGFPGCPGESVALCEAMRKLLSYGAYTELVQDVLVQAQYWHDPVQFDKYVETSVFLAEINNEKPVKNASYPINLAQLDNFVMVYFEDDVTVEPRESGHFDYYYPGNEYDIQPLKDSLIYTEDRIGLKSLDDAGKLSFMTTPGGHLEFTDQWFIDNIVVPYLNN